MLTMALKPVKMSLAKSRGEGLGSAMRAAGRRKSAAWVKAMLAMVARVVRALEARLLLG